MEHRQAREIAETLVEAMRPFCERIQIAGSLRRGKPNCKDIEIVAIPKWEAVEMPPENLFASFYKPEFQLRNLLFEWAATQGDIRWIKPGKTEIESGRINPDGKYWRGWLPAREVKLDLFLCKPDNWGAIYLIRTGSAEFSQAVVTQAKRIGKPCRDGFFTRDGEPVATPEEIAVFDLLNLEYAEPANRIDGSVLRAKR